MTKDEVVDCIARCEGMPEDPEAQLALRLLRQSLAPRREDEVQKRFDRLLSNYAIALIGGDEDEIQRALVAFRLSIAAVSAGGAASSSSQQ